MTGARATVTPENLALAVPHMPRAQDCSACLRKPKSELDNPQSTHAAPERRRRRPSTTVPAVNNSTVMTIKPHSETVGMACSHSQPRLQGTGHVTPPPHGGVRSHCGSGHIDPSPRYEPRWVSQQHKLESGTHVLSGKQQAPGVVQEAPVPPTTSLPAAVQSSAPASSVSSEQHPS